LPTGLPGIIESSTRILKRGINKIKLISPDEWNPIGIDSLEERASKAIKNISNNILVVAGPGSGKTELLAQKACYLLQTGICTFPRRILAISFKRDAAANLKNRVILRCGSELARRFDSMTFDAFAKSLLDRFKNGLPQKRRVSKDYEIDYTLFNDRNTRGLLESIVGTNGLTYGSIAEIEPSNFERRYMCSKKLNENGFEEADPGFIAAELLWNQLIKNVSNSKLTFPMISRLTEYLLIKNRKILQALQFTYSYVFLDEFQDTTNIQYDLVKTCFLNTSSKLIAVGDNKQRIMDWAGALDRIFDKYQFDFKSENISLLFNYRSTQNLVNIQYNISCAIENKEIEKIIAKNAESEDDGCFVYSFDNYESEAEYISNMIENIINNERIVPRDICILSRNRPDVYSQHLKDVLIRRKIKARVESEVQDLLSEPLTKLIINYLKLSVYNRSPEDWSQLRDYYILTNGYDDENLTTLIERRINQDIKVLKDKIMMIKIIDEPIIFSLIKDIIKMLDENKLKNEYRQYSQGNYYRDIVKQIAEKLTTSFSDLSWKKAMDEFEGKDSIPIMTIHKSKGLEYHTVIFIGLEDSALWGFNSNPMSETCSFFVAFSRAKKRVVFTFCRERPDRGSVRRQSRTNIYPLYELLTSAGIKIHDINGKYE
jgi:superfamily I DNA/RNA helicase